MDFDYIGKPTIKSLERLHGARHLWEQVSPTMPIENLVEVTAHLQGLLPEQSFFIGSFGQLDVDKAVLCPICQEKVPRTSY